MLFSPAYLATLTLPTLERALGLGVQPGRPGYFLVDGGKELHWVNLIDPDVDPCDCGAATFNDGAICKHAAAALIASRHPATCAFAFRMWTAERGADAEDPPALPVVGFLQNQWVRGGISPRLERAFAERPKFRRDMLDRLLFGGCTTGRRLRSHFGRAACDAIRWDEASPQVGSQSSDVFPADPDHIRAVLAEERPAIVLAFGKVATDALPPLLPSGARLIVGPHPAARMPDINDRLDAMAKQLRAALRRLEAA